MSKLLKFDAEAREKLLKGVDILTEAVSSTLGPKGRNVAISKSWGAPSVVHDGVTVAKEIELEDPFENMGAQLLKEAASKTADVAGDGTTTSTILARAMVSESLRAIANGANPMILKKGIELAVNTLVLELKKISKKLITPEEIEQVATISASSEEIGKMISEAIKKVGKDGVITVEEGKSIDTTVDHKEGMEFDKGFLSHYFVTDPNKMEATLDGGVSILITDKKISSSSELVPFMEKFVSGGRKSLVIIADEIEGEALALLILNKLRGVMDILAISAPGFGDRRKEMLEDIAILTGGRVLSEETGEKLDSVDPEAILGKALRVTATKDSTLIVGGEGKKSLIEARINQLRVSISQTDSEFDREKLAERLAKLTGGVAVINVGAATEVELKEKKERVIDAVAATKAAIEEGIVPGGEITLIRIKDSLDTLKVEGEEKLGVEIVKNALSEPFKKLMSNAGLDEGLMLAKVSEVKGNLGVDVSDGTIKDLVKAGVIDPVKVTRSALQNASSVSVMLATTNVLIADKPEPPAPPPPGNPGMEY